MCGNLLAEKMSQPDHRLRIVMSDIEACSLKTLIVGIDEHAAFKDAIGIPLGVVHAGIELPDRGDAGIDEENRG